MKSRLIKHAAFSLVGVIVTGTCANAEVIEFEDGQNEEWESAVGDFTTIPFTEYPFGTIITDQYSNLGAHFVNGGVIVEPDWDAFPEDGAGLTGPPFSPIWLSFDQPMTHIAVDFPDEIVFYLFSDGELIYTSDEFGLPGSAGHFAGLHSADAFDEVWLWTEEEFSPYIDNLHFGPPIPAPGALALLAFGVLSARSGRRRS
jgi:hypothetical protein